MEFERGCEFVFSLQEKITDELLFDRWVASYQTIGFDDFKKEIKKKSRTQEKIPETKEEAQEVAKQTLINLKKYFG